MQLATLVDAPPEGEKWLHEIKFDGYRLLGLSLGRRGRPAHAQRPRLDIEVSLRGTRPLQASRQEMPSWTWKPSFSMKNGKSGFQALQAALGEGGRRDRIVAYAFDLLHLDGKDLTRLKLTERKDKLAEAAEEIETGNLLKVQRPCHGRVARKCSPRPASLGLEGIVSKRADAPYTTGRDKNWLKAKCQQRQEFIIIGYSNAKSGGRALGALYLGYHRGGALTYAGKVGTGFTMKSALALTDKLETLAVDKPVLDRTAMSGPGAGEFHVDSLGQAGIAVRSHLHRMDRGRPHPASLLPGFAGGQESRRGENGKTSSRPKRPENVALCKAPAAKGLVLEGITITHPERVISDTGHVTKGELAEYHAAVAPYMLPRLLRHPLSLLRCPSGIGNQCFYQRNPGKGLGADVKPFKFRHKGKSYEYLYIEDVKGLHRNHPDGRD